MSADRHFSDSMWAMGWRANVVVGVLWAYFDESGEHARGSGMLRRLTLGCAIARREDWEALEVRWNEVLVDAGIDQFHMSDFEARKPPFEGWDNEKRRDILGRLIDIAADHVPIFVGCNDLPGDMRTMGQFRSAYRENIAKLVTEFTRFESAMLQGEPVTMIFSAHKDIRAQTMERWFDNPEPRFGGRIKFGSFESPKGMPPLQVADIAAYEFSRTSREVRPEAERYPLVALASRAKTFTLLSA